MTTLNMEIYPNGTIDLIPGDYQVYTVYTDKRPYRVLGLGILRIVLIVLIMALIGEVVNTVRTKLATFFFFASWFCWKMSLGFGRLYREFNHKYCF